MVAQVPNVAKPKLIKFMEDSCLDHGYTMEWKKNIVTGMQGCPQTRDRLLVMLANKRLPRPALPEPIMEDWNSRAVNNMNIYSVHCPYVVHTCYYFL
jgi:hypothetical protein